MCDFGRKIRLNFGEDFFFWRPPVFGLKNRLNFRIWPKNQTQFRRRPFFFLILETTCFWTEKSFEFPNLAEKSDSISAKTFFFFFFFFFLETTCFWAEKTFELSAFREISSQFSDKPCETDSRAMKNRVKVVCSFLTLSKKPPPPFSKSWLRACICGSKNLNLGF